MHTAGSAAPLVDPNLPAEVPKPTWRIPLLVAGVAVVVRLIPAILAYGTSDVATWELIGRMLLNGENFYATQLHNWPPLWIYFTAAAILAHGTTGLPFSTLVKLPPIAADALIAVILCRLQVTSKSTATAAGLAYALNPVSILITGYHGQFDSLMLAPTFLAWYLWQRRPANTVVPHATLGVTSDVTPHVTSDVTPHVTSDVTPYVTSDVTPHVTSDVTPRVTSDVTPHVTPHVTPAPYTQGRRRGVVGPVPARASADGHLIASALALGVGIWFKPVPLLLLPVLLPRLPTWRNRLTYTALALTPAALGTLPFLLMWPGDVATNFLGYSSWFGQWGYPSSGWRWSTSPAAPSPGGCPIPTTSPNPFD